MSSIGEEALKGGFWSPGDVMKRALVFESFTDKRVDDDGSFCCAVRTSRPFEAELDPFGKGLGHDPSGIILVADMGTLLCREFSAGGTQYSAWFDCDAGGLQLRMSRIVIGSTGPGGQAQVVNSVQGCIRC
jgi:hypothetical protein